jgi:N utilization substance protein B
VAVGKAGVEDCLDVDVLGNTFTEETSAFVDQLVRGTLERGEELDGRFLTFLAAGWDLDRIAVIDKLVLRMACFELWSADEVPPKVVINEYVNLAKLYGSADSGKFVNGVLAKVMVSSPKANFKPTEGAGAPRKRVKAEEPETPEPTPKGKKWVIKAEG